MSLGNHEKDLETKSPQLQINTDELRLLMTLKSFSKLDKNKSNSLLFWLREG